MATKKTPTEPKPKKASIPLPPLEERGFYTLDESVPIVGAKSRQGLYVMIRNQKIPEACILRLGERNMRLRKAPLHEWLATGCVHGVPIDQPKSAA